PPQFSIRYSRSTILTRSIQTYVLCARVTVRTEGPADDTNGAIVAMPIDSPVIERAADFIWRHARLLDRQRFAFHFCDAPAAPVVAALRPYQNADGGFGNALEPDKRCPDSQPVDAETALRVLDELNDEAVWRDPLVEHVISFLERI